MSKNPSAVKRDQISQRNNLRNKNYKSTIKTLIKKVLLEINSSSSMDYEKVNSFISQAYSKIDKAVKKRIIPKNSAARKKSLLSNSLEQYKKNQR